jgi:hypothetical protein
MSGGLRGLDAYLYTALYAALRLRREWSGPENPGREQQSKN